MEVIYQFPTPPSLNAQLGAANRNRFVNASMKKKETNACANIVRGSLVQFPGEVWMQVHIEYKRSIDPDNLFASLKFVFDGLVKAGVIIDDSPKIIQSPILYSWAKAPKGKEPLLTLQILDYCPVKSPAFLVSQKN